MSPRIAHLEAQLEPPRSQTSGGFDCRLLGHRSLDGRCGEFLEAILARHSDASVPMELEPFGSSFMKGGPLHGKSAWRHGLWTRMGRLPPRLAEFQNLRRLASDGFLAPEPLQAGAALIGPRLVAQWLITARLDGSGSLQALIGQTELGQTLTRTRATALVATARELGRLHGLGWYHGDAYPRNLLVLSREGQLRAGFLDLWRGGPLHRGARPPGPIARLRCLRGWARDLGCFFLHGALWLSPAEGQAFLARYLKSLEEISGASGWRPDAARLLTLARAARAREWRRFERDPRRRQGLPEPPREWSPAPLDKLGWPVRANTDPSP